jgi:hypothetical protein
MANLIRSRVQELVSSSSGDVKNKSTGPTFPARLVVRCERLRTDISGGGAPSAGSEPIRGGAAAGVGSHQRRTRLLVSRARPSSVLRPRRDSSSSPSQPRSIAATTSQRRRCSWRGDWTGVMVVEGQLHARARGWRSHRSRSAAPTRRAAPASGVDCPGGERSVTALVSRRGPQLYGKYE